jgi:hypothetical protein
MNIAEFLGRGASGASPGEMNIGDILGRGAPGASPEEMKKLGKSANQLWKFLDDLAVKDPAAYKDFLKKQAEEAGVDMNRVEEEAAGPTIVLEAALESSSTPGPRVAIVKIWGSKGEFKRHSHVDVLISV